MTQHRPGLGIALILLMAACFGTMDTSVKYLGAFVPVLVILWGRYTVQAVSMAAWLTRSRLKPGGAGFRAAHPRFQVARGLLLLSSSTCAFFGLQYLPVAEFTAISMLTPVMVTLLAGWVLREQIGALRWVLVGGGFVGALVVIRPGSGLFGWAVLFPLVGALAYASFQVLTRKLSGLESPYTTHFYTGLTGSLVMMAALLVSSVDLLPFFSTAEPRHIALLLGIGVLGTVGHLMLVLAFGLAPTSTLMPFQYAQIGFAALVGWLVFRRVPDGWGWLGMGIVALCGAASAWLNVRDAAAARRPVSPLGVDTVSD
jgi:drug/metabolite transporter (DMT)-like permease